MDPAQPRGATASADQAPTPAVVIPMPRRAPVPRPAHAEAPHQVPRETAEPCEEPGYGHGV